MNPSAWAEKTSRLFPRSSLLTQWFPGTFRPVHRGMYVRHFSGGDGKIFSGCLSVQYWDGLHWLIKQGGNKHRHQVGSYPCWQGLTRTLLIGDEVVLFLGSKKTGKNHEPQREVNATLVQFNAPNTAWCTLLDDDPKSRTNLRFSGQTGAFNVYRAFDSK